MRFAVLCVGFDEFHKFSRRNTAPFNVKTALYIANIRDKFRVIDESFTLTAEDINDG